MGERKEQAFSWSLISHLTVRKENSLSTELI